MDSSIASPFHWDPSRRELLRAELDAAFFHLYGIERDDVDYIMESFPIVKRQDEAAHGEYRTKRLILEIYDRMAEAEVNGEEYQTLLDPPPADPSLQHDPSTRPDWADRDRFVLSAGHGSMLLYSLLHLTGHKAMTMEQIRNFRQWGSNTPGHPEVFHTPGVETTTGPLGQGLATAVGMAMAETLFGKEE